MKTLDPVSIISTGRDLFTAMSNQTDPRSRMQSCRQAIGFGRSAVKVAENLSDSEIIEIQDTLRLAHRMSKGTYNANASITKLAKFRMDRLGITKLPATFASRSKLVGTDTACLALSGERLPEDWFQTSQALQDMDQGKYAMFGVGADGGYRLRIRVIDAVDHFLEPAEYKYVTEVLPPFALWLGTGSLYFGAAENITQGVQANIETGRYTASVTALRQRGKTTLLATLIKSDTSIPELAQIPEFQEL